jgi:hypothetical protein
MYIYTTYITWCTRDSKTNKLHASTHGDIHTHMYACTHNFSTFMVQYMYVQCSNGYTYMAAGDKYYNI